MDVADSIRRFSWRARLGVPSLVTLAVLLGTPGCDRLLDTDGDMDAMATSGEASSDGIPATSSEDSGVSTMTGGGSGDEEETTSGLACEDGLLECDGQCVDPSSDAAHCGGCNVTCGEGSCDAGTCQPAACAEGLTWCDSSLSCEDLMYDRENCGACGRDCNEEFPEISTWAAFPHDLNCAAGICRDGGAPCEPFPEYGPCCDQFDCTDPGSDCKCRPLGCGGSCESCPSFHTCINDTCVYQDPCEAGTTECTGLINGACFTSEFWVVCCEPDQFCDASDQFFGPACIPF